MKLFEKMRLWIDPVGRPGPEAMAVDEWLLETVNEPLLRVYRWKGDWVSIGYFGQFEATQRDFPGLGIVRRWTGGGVVDHRKDWTYSLLVPKNEQVASERGAESYRKIHFALGQVLTERGIDVRLSSGNEETGAAHCFANPVSHDLVGPDNRKMAGAGQRRSCRGLLHQGSVAIPAKTRLEKGLAESFADEMSNGWTQCHIEPPSAEIGRRVETRYASGAWNRRR